MTNLDAEFVELIDTVGPRRARILATTAHQIAAEIRTAADALGTAAVGRDQRHILAALPACTYTQSRIRGPHTWTRATRKPYAPSDPKVPGKGPLLTGVASRPA
ncbi:MAG: hypothetical protein L0H31_03655 [Nocardioidaceae bacterium]|nr:hypothetical protein [Nocardioidaceae bacterium]